MRMVHAPSRDSRLQFMPFQASSNSLKFRLSVDMWTNLLSFGRALLYRHFQMQLDMCNWHKWT
jgi:hypothetical protein